MVQDEVGGVQNGVPETAANGGAVAPASEEQGPAPKQLDADTILDTIVPPSIDWRGTVVRHPLLSVLGVGLIGYVVGRTKGATILAGVTAGISSALMRQLADVFESNLFEFD